ncbi:hypothetical protein B0J17DRAFT_702573 [Rhizoctonia solani]|nr:hypothetical protein B0J17DRAFT_702573 [Rhizoctonia solani]
MSTKQNASTFASTLCRCGRTSSLDDNSQVARGRLECGHYICADCWHYNNPLPTPICNVCVLHLQAQEIPRLSFYVTAYHDMVGRFKELERIHSQKIHEYKQANEVIAMLKAKVASFQRVQPSNPAASSSSPISPAQQLPNVSITSSSSGVKSPIIDWQSESGKQVSVYIMKQRETLLTCQRECESLKSRVKDLTAQLEAKNRPDAETVTAIEKAELMEAELEGLHGRLTKCEDDLEKARAELGAANLQNQQLSKGTVDSRKEAAQQRAAMAKVRFEIASLKNRCETAERDLASARASLKAKDEAIKANARSPRGRSVDLPSPSRSAGERTMVYIPTAIELEQSATRLVSLQNDVSRLNREKSAIEQLVYINLFTIGGIQTEGFREITQLKAFLKAQEEENQALGGKLRQSAELASELGKLHLAANSRAEAAEEKLLDIQKEMQELKELMEIQARENNAMQNTASIASGLIKLTEHQSRITQLESQLAEITRVRDKAIAQCEIWKENRNSWKRWGELMALRAKQWEDEVSKAKTPHATDVLAIMPEEPPSMASGALPDLGKSPKLHTDDGPSLTVDLGGEGADRKRARFTAS